MPNPPINRNAYGVRLLATLGIRNMQRLAPTDFAIAIAIAVVVVALLVHLFRGRAKSQGAKAHALSRGPANLHFACAGCSAQTTHTKRTVAAWEKGNHRYFCDSCHKKWRESLPKQRQQEYPAAVQAPEKLPAAHREAASVQVPASIPRQRGLAPARSGCLSVFLALVILPTATAIVIFSAYA